MGGGQLCLSLLALADVCVRSDGTKWLAALVAADNYAAAQNPFVTSILAAQAVFDLITLCLAGDIVGVAGKHALPVIRMNTAFPFLVIGQDFVFRVAQHFFPTPGIFFLTGLKVSVPDAVAAAFDGKPPSKFTLCQILLLPL